MFKNVITHKGFWKSVFLLGMLYMSIIFLVQWALLGFAPEFFTSKPLWVVLSTFVSGSLISGFFVSYAKFWARLKRKQ